MKTSSPDYEGQTPDDAVKDFRNRIAQYKSVYQPLENESLSWIKLVDTGRQIVANRIRGSLQSRVLQFVINLHTIPRPIYLSRHGQSEYNVAGRVGGDSSLSPDGEAYALKLAEFVKNSVLNDTSLHKEMCNPAHTRLWTSSLKRTIDTARHIKHNVQDDGWITMRPRVYRNLDELYAGVFDGMTYEEIQAAAPEEYAARLANKLTYRYPRGESYIDVISRLEAMIHEIERQRDPVFLVCHQGILRIIYAYLMNIPREQAPFVKIPLNMVIKLVPNAYGCQEERILLKEPILDAPSH